MTDTNGLPDSNLIGELTRKAQTIKNSDFNHIAIIDGFRTRVSSEVRQINQLFPEYTPHDEMYHLHRLFSIADQILGKDLLKRLNCAELFVLTLGIYGHDWGMAVSEVEKELIQYNKIRDGYDSKDFPLLYNEHQKFLDYLQRINGSIDNSSVNINDWREYVRLTHAQRSQERIIKFFEKMSNGVGIAVGKLCVGHWLDFKALESNTDYPTNYSVLGEPVNVKALTIYLRLIDLLDISEDRTPYIIWKFVAPLNLRSKMEWEKHRSINSIACSPYQDSRIVQIDASTDDHEVYASLIDLKNYCETQLSKCNDLLYQLNNPKYNLNIYDIKWRIQTRNFKPLSIQFEFDRSRVFEILADEIYQTDTHVFIRELLQNSVDAIIMRKEVLKNEGLADQPLESFGKISIDVSDLREDIIEIAFKDNGIGMDEYIIKNYLSIAGKSYYSSEDFKRLGLNMDPISKFGIGILSCFMAADRVEITTYRDPYVSEKKELIKINILSVQQQFRIQVEELTNSQDIGTTVKVYASIKKMTASNPELTSPYLHITKYVSTVAAYVKIPIKISENKKETIVIHPDLAVDEYQNKYPNSHILQLTKSASFEEIFLPQSLTGACALFKKEVININERIGTSELEGTIVHIVPKNPKLLLFNKGRSWPADDFLGQLDGKSYRLKIDDSWTRFNQYKTTKTNLGRSASHHKSLRTYLNGIMVPNGNSFSQYRSDQDWLDHDLGNSPFRSYGTNYSKLWLPSITLNIKNTKTQNTDISRLNFINDPDILLKQINSVKKKALIEDRLPAIKQMSLSERMDYLAALMTVYRIPPSEIVSVVTADLIPVIYIDGHGKINLKEWAKLKQQNIKTSTRHSKKCISSVSSWFSNRTITKIGVDEHFHGDFILTYSYGSYSGDDDDISIQLQAVIHLTKYIISSQYTLHSIVFPSSNNAVGDPWLLWTLNSSINTSSAVDDSIISRVNAGEEQINISNIGSILSVFSDWNNKNSSQLDIYPTVFVKFSDSSIFSFRLKYLNIDHKISQFLVSVMCGLYLARKTGKIERSQTGHLADLLNELPFFSYSHEENIDITKTQKILDEISEIYNKFELSNNPIQLGKLDDEFFHKSFLIQ